MVYPLSSILLFHVILPRNRRPLHRVRRECRAGTAVRAAPAGGPAAVLYLPQALALAVVLEFAPITAGLLVAGRTGASLGAELGSMRLTEQVDALEVLGLSPMRELVAPRLLACMLSLPLLTLFIMYLALGSGYLAEALGGSLSWAQYRNECL